MFFLSKLFYNLGLKLYFFFIFIASFFNTKAKQFINGRKIKIETISNESIWFHCASLGEFEQARPLLEKIKNEYPNYKVVLSFFSPSGYEIKKNYQQADFIYYLPMDSKKNARNFIQKINPSIVIFVKYEFWYYYLQELNQKKIATYLVSGIFRKKQLFFQAHGVFFKKMLNNFSHLFVQDKNSLDLLHSIQIHNTSQANDTRFDRVLQIKNQAKKFKKIEAFVADNKCIVLGSSWLEDEKLFAAVEDQWKDYKLIVAPHNINTQRITEVQKIFKNSICYSQLSEQNQHYQVLIIDNIGMLSSIYGFGQIAYIGGGFGVSIHNILEAAVYGVPVLFGPKHKKMKEALDLIELEAAVEIKDESSLRKTLQKLDKVENQKKYGFVAGKYVKENTGGTEKILNHLKKQKNLR